jgi:hypothetical protein
MTGDGNNDLDDRYGDDRLHDRFNIGFDDRADDGLDAGFGVAAR